MEETGSRRQETALVLGVSVSCSKICNCAFVVWSKFSLKPKQVRCLELVLEVWSMAQMWSSFYQPVRHCGILVVESHSVVLYQLLPTSAYPPIKVYKQNFPIRNRQSASCRYICSCLFMELLLFNLTKYVCHSLCFGRTSTYFTNCISNMPLVSFGRRKFASCLLFELLGQKIIFCGHSVPTWWN